MRPLLLPPRVGDREAAAARLQVVGDLEAAEISLIEILSIMGMIRNICYPPIIREIFPDRTQAEEESVLVRSADFSMNCSHAVPAPYRHFCKIGGQISTNRGGKILFL